MTREEQVRICKTCQHSGFDAAKGVICKLTNDVATFEEDCPDIKVDSEKEAEAEQANVTRKKETDKELRAQTIPIGLFVPLIAIIMAAIIWKKNKDKATYYVLFALVGFLLRLFIMAILSR